MTNLWVPEMTKLQVQRFQTSLLCFLQKGLFKIFMWIFFCFVYWKRNMYAKFFALKSIKVLMVNCSRIVDLQHSENTAKDLVIIIYFLILTDICLLSALYCFDFCIKLFWSRHFCVLIQDNLAFSCWFSWSWLNVYIFCLFCPSAFRSS